MQRFNTYTIKFEDENIFELMSYRFYKILTKKLLLKLSNTI